MENYYFSPTSLCRIDFQDEGAFQVTGRATKYLGPAGWLAENFISKQIKQLYLPDRGIPAPDAEYSLLHRVGEKGNTTFLYFRYAAAGRQ